MEPGKPAVALNDLDSLAVLEDPVRRQLYELVCAAPAPIGRDESATTIAISRSLAAYHLDKLAESGLLEVAYERLGEKRGRGGGRPAKLYMRAKREFALSTPPRDYELLAELVVRAAADEAVQGAVQEAARAL